VVRFPAQAAVGTYSYAVGPAIQDRIRGASFTVTPVQTVTFNAPPDQVNLRIPPGGTGGTDTGQDITTSTLTVAGIPADQVISDVNVNLRLTHTFDGDLILTLIAPDGTRVLLANQRGGSGDNYGVNPNNPGAPTPRRSTTRRRRPSAIWPSPDRRSSARSGPRCRWTSSTSGAPTGTGRWRSMTRRASTSGPCWPGR
jgi:hypothetical protein